MSITIHPTRILTLQFRRHRRVVFELCSSPVKEIGGWEVSPSEFHAHYYHLYEEALPCPVPSELCTHGTPHAELRLVKHSDDFESYEIPCECCEPSGVELPSSLAHSE